jgi:geranylgeranyl diphosphate synthase, type II
LLDAYGDSKKFGKQVGGDIIANKKTFLLIKSLELAKEHQRQELQDWLSRKKFNKTEKVNAIKSIYDALDIPAQTEKKVNSYFKKGFSRLRDLKCSAKGKTGLIKFTELLIGRES